MPTTYYHIEQCKYKSPVVQALLSRLKPNVYVNSNTYWIKIAKGLHKMNISEIDALEALIMGNQRYHQEE